VRARIYAGRAAYFSGDPLEAKVLLAEAVARGRAADREGKPVMLAVALSFFGYFQASGGAVEEGLTALQEAVAVATASGNPVQANEALSMQGNVCMGDGRYLDAKAAFEAILETCRHFELPYDELMARLNLAAALLELGRAPEALEHAEQVTAVSQARQRRFPEAFARAVAGRAHVQLGALATGEAELKAGLALAREIASRYLELHVLVPWADALVAMGRLPEANEALAEARRIATELHNTEHDGLLDRVEHRAALQAALAPDSPLAELAAVGERLADWSTRLRSADKVGDLAHALVLQATWAHRCSNLAPGVTWVDEALTLAEQAGLELVAAEALYVRARLSVAAAQVNSSVSGLIEAAVAGFAKAGDRAQALGDVRLDALCTAGALLAQGLVRELPPVARKLEALTEGLSPEHAAAFMAHPELQEVTRTLPPIMGLSREARDVLGLMASFDQAEDLPELLKRAVVTMVEFAGARRGFLLLFEDMDITHQVVYRMTPYEADDFSSSLAYQVLWTEEPLFVEDAQSDGHFAGQASIRALDLRSIVGVPLMVDGATVGVMIADSQYITASFGDFHLDLLMALARRVAGAIGVSRRREEEERRVAVSDMLERLAMATAGCVTLEEIMAPVAAEAIALTGSDRLCLVAGPDLACLAAFDSQGRTLDASAQAPSQSACRWVYEHGEPLHLHDALTSETFSAQKSVMALGLRTIHAVPVAYGGRTLGVLYLDDRSVGVEDPQVTKALQRVGAMVGAILTRRNLLA
jgi:GAF domain-containing protein